MNTTITIYHILISTRFDDDINCIVAQGTSIPLAFKKAIEEIKESLASAELEYEPYSNSIKFIKDDGHKAEDEFKYYYDYFTDLESVLDSSWKIMTTKIVLNTPAQIKDLIVTTDG